MANLRWNTIVAGGRSEYARLLDRAFSLSPPSSYLEDFPVWDPEVPRQERRYQLGGYLGTRLVATASIRFVDYAFGAARESIGLVGAVATHPDFQGRGYGSAAIDILLQEGRKRGVRAFALWGSESALYSKRGFRFGGVQLRSALSQVVIEGETLDGFEVRNGWDETIAEALLARSDGVQYRDVDALWLSRHRGVEWRTLWLDGKCLAYGGWNRGIDLPNIVHELGGTFVAQRTLVGFLKTRYPGLELLHHPNFSTRGIRALSPAEPLAQFRFDDANHPLASRVDELWFSGMDSC